MSPAALRKFLKKLRKDFPAKLPVRVRQQFIPLDDPTGRCYGHTSKGDKSFLIVLHSTMSDALGFEMLLHEWAHAVTWAGKVDHSPRWAAKYAAIRRWYQCENEWANIP